MTRGPKTAAAIDEAAAVCSGAGLQVLPIGGKHKSADLLVIGTGRVRLIRVRRPHTVLKDPDAVARRYCREISHLRELPVSDCLEKELMLLHPGKTWLTFRILPESIQVKE